MDLLDRTDRYALWATELDHHSPLGPTRASQLCEGLNDGLNLLRDLCYRRIHDDVQAHLGLDSMLLPASPGESAQACNLEIEAAQIAESTDYVHARQLVNDRHWYQLWLTRMRTSGEADRELLEGRVEDYLERSAEERVQVFSRRVQRAWPEASRAPLVLFRLFPLAARLVTAVAFGRQLDATELRNQQMACLPSIDDCGTCLGRPLENGEQCRNCGNPLWNYHWLTASD